MKRFSHHEPFNVQIGSTAAGRSLPPHVHQAILLHGCRLVYLSYAYLYRFYIILIYFSINQLQYINLIKLNYVD